MCEIGTDDGGQIEIYATEKNAKKRNDYLSTFDGGILASYHTQKGTLVIRLSSKLTETQQKELSEKIVEVLSE